MPPVAMARPGLQHIRREGVVRSLAGFILLALAWLTADSAAARVFYAQDEALRAAFPEAETIEKRTFLLTDEQAAKIEGLSRARLQSRMVTVHIGKQQQKLLGYAMIDIHVVRTNPEAVMVVLTPEGVIQSTLVLAFHEPLEYLPPARWMKQFPDKTLTPDLAVGQKIAAITGATLSTNGVTDSARRALAFYQVMLAPPAR
jgi:hypothetical protein